MNNHDKIFFRYKEKEEQEVIALPMLDLFIVRNINDTCFRLRISEWFKNGTIDYSVTKGNYTEFTKKLPNWVVENLKAVEAAKLRKAGLLYE